MGINEWFQSVAAEQPQKRFLAVDGEWYTYEDVRHESMVTAKLFQSLGIEQGDVVLAMLPNCIEYIHLFLGVSEIGGVLACVNTDMQGDGLRHLIQSADADIAIVASRNIKQYNQAAPNVATDPDRVVLFGDRPVSSDGESIDSENTEGGDYDRFIELKRSRSETSDGSLVTNVQPGSPVSLIHTSGTTGPPKWCELSHKYYLKLGRIVRDRFQIHETDVLFDPLPFYHINAQGIFVCSVIAAKATGATVSEFSASTFWDSVQSVDATVLILHFSVVDILNSGPEGTTNHDVRMVFPANEEFQTQFDIPIGISGYGSTEAGSFTHIKRMHIDEIDAKPSDESLSQLAGPPREDITCAIVDDNDNKREPNDHGEIVIRPSEPFVIFNGYYHQPQKTVDATQNLWYHTGDLGYIDDSGELHFMGRIADSIRVRGEFVNVDWVEKRLRNHEAIQDACIIGVDAEIGADEVKAFVKPDATNELVPSELISWCAEELPSHMIPRYIETVEEFPRTPGTKKIQKKELSDDVDSVWDRTA